MLRSEVTQVRAGRYALAAWMVLAAVAVMPAMSAPPGLAKAIVVEPDDSTGLDLIDRIVYEAVTEQALHQMRPTGTALCFEVDTPTEYVEAILNNNQDFFEQYILGGRWSSSSYGSFGSRGNPGTLSWGVVNDGTLIFSCINGTFGPSNLIAQMDAKFGGDRDLWMSRFTQSFDRWGEVHGIDYIFEPNDDGVPVTSSNGGIIGVRADVRIGGRTMDGSGGVLACNNFPQNGGDMSIDTADQWQQSFGGHRFLRNVLMHEHGHGHGLQHVCPQDCTKLMEAFLCTNFDGPQDDDIRGGQWQYGDDFENDDNSASATDLNSLSPAGSAQAAMDPGSLDPTGGGTIIIDLDLDVFSTNDTADRDWSKFTLGGPGEVTVAVRPIGSTYFMGACGFEREISTDQISDLAFRLYDTDASTILAEVDDTGFGNDEFLINFPLPVAGTYYLEVFNAATTTNDVQRYRLRVIVTQFETGCPPTPGDMDGDGDVDIADFSTFAACFTGSGGQLPPGCECADLDGDGDVDISDFSTFAANFTGSQ